MSIEEWDSIFEWENICYSIKTSNEDGKPEKRQILKGLSGRVVAGELVSVLGQSGSGKTSFLNSLSFRTPYSSSSSLTGRILLDGKVADETTMQLSSSYVEQDLSLFTYLTVEETLYLSAKFNLNVSLSEEDIERAVCDVMTELCLSKVKRCYVGGPNERGISGGERKRVAIAKELFSNPRILFMDEPTSGLDSFQAQSVSLLSPEILSHSVELSE